MSQKQPSLLERMRQGEKLTAAQQLELVVTLSIPAIMAQITSIVMQYIDASMVGSLGADASASIGLVSSSTWLFGGITGAVASGFSIQAAHKIGAGREDEARSIMRQSLLTGILISCALLVLGVMISGPLPGVLGGEMQIRHGATVYFRIFVLFLPVLQMNRLAGSLLQCSGDMKTPGMLNVLMCMLDVLFNAVLIFPSRTVDFLGIHLWIPGAGLQVAGAALGTALAELVVAGLMLWALCVRSSVFRLKKGEDWGIKSECLQKALRLGGPLALENILTCCNNRHCGAIGNHCNCSEFLRCYSRKLMLYAWIRYCGCGGNPGGTEHWSWRTEYGAQVYTDDSMAWYGSDDTDRDFYVYGCALYDGDLKPGYAGVPAGCQGTED